MSGSDLIDRAREAEELGLSLLNLAAELRRRSTVAEAPPPALTSAHQTLAQSVGNLRALRARRAEHLAPALFGEPAWDMLLALFDAHLAWTELTSNQVQQASGVYAATATRWIRVLIHLHQIEVVPAVGPGLPDRVRLTHEGVVAMTRATLGLRDTL